MGMQLGAAGRGSVMPKMATVKGRTFRPRFQGVRAQAQGKNSNPVYVKVNTIKLGSHPVTVGEFLRSLGDKPRYGIFATHKPTGQLHLVAEKIEGQKRAKGLPIFTDHPLNWVDMELNLDPVEFAPSRDAWLNLLCKSGEVFANPNHPAVQVTEYNQAGYFHWLNRETEEDRKTAGLGVFRPPTQEERWNAELGPEGNLDQWPTPNNKLEDEQGRPQVHDDGSEARATGPVDQYPGIQFEDGVVYGLAGNVWERTSTLWTPDKDLWQGAESLITAGAVIDNPQGPAQTKYEGSRAVLGGSWSSYAENLRQRNYIHPDGHFNNIGFRVSASLPQAPKHGVKSF